MQGSGFAQFDPSAAARLEWAYRFRAEESGALTDPQCGSELAPVVSNAVANTQMQAPPAGNNWVAAACVVPRLFSPEECTRILAFEDKLQLEAGRMVRPGLSTRRCLYAWMDHADDNAWVYERIAQSVHSANQNYRYDLFGMMDPLQFTRYDSDRADEIGWHLDCGEGPNTTRKLSVSIQLSDPDAYEGGDLEFHAMPPLAFSRLQGAAILFPAFLSHRVTPITQGSRYSLVAFINGPPFR